MKNAPVQARGFTLIELIVTLALLAILRAMVAPLKGGWTDRSRVQSAKSSLKTAISQARTAAIRNTENRLSSQTAASACIDTSALTITAYRITGTNDPCSSSNTKLKEASFASGVSFKQGGTSVTCFVFNANGVLMNSGSCATTLDTITIKKNVEEEEIDAI